MPKTLPIIDMNAPVCCSPVAAQPLDDVAALEVALRLKALADPMRVRLLSLILTCENDQHPTTGALAAIVGLAESTVSHHLGQLRTAGLIASDRRGMTVHHIARRDALAALRDVLDPHCCEC
ncbi:Rv2640c family ArsR-like transcriptional regulator [Gordonia crocea]|uniref:Putative transcriptional regulator, ArsR family protein n=1 Tax=Gordonia crocea TaxID=589162 RepID=A0A7I9UVV3_9ACTN|nr:Rv2640c family ArsR-like transcriptional regulator [Gordonia crocea]GED96891.1 putative transcriptional regulator, ArsR family protein [Gordonia crocea]